MVSHWSLTNRTFLQVSGTLLTILVVLLLIVAECKFSDFSVYFSYTFSYLDRVNRKYSKVRKVGITMSFLVE